MQQRDLQPVNATGNLPAELEFDLPNRMRQNQEWFGRTGGIHAAGLFDTTGRLQCIREDVGRHNALDKLIGHQFLGDKLPASDSVLEVSGRASFELLQKALTAAIPYFVAVGAPSSLAVELAEQFHITLIGFTTVDRFNIYTHPSSIC